MAGRRPRQDELDLWRKVAENTQRLQSERKAAQTPLSNLKTPSTPPPVKPSVKPFALGQKAKSPSPSHEVLPGVHEQVAARPVAMDRKAYGRLKRGKLKPEGKLDLHGMTLDQAHPALTRFILSAQASGKRLVLVVTGKGKQRDDGGPIPTRMGVLRHNVPAWLGQPPLAQAVLQITQAHLRHGGGGAYYVYLRRQRVG